MVIKRGLLRFLGTVLLFLKLVPLHAQTEENPFIQRLAWKGDEYALRYEVLIEREEGAGYRRHLQRSTNAAFIEVSLPPGKYRYRVTPFDFLNRPSEGSRWVNFEVRIALKPELDDFPPVSLSPDGDAEYVLNITGKNLDPDAEIFLYGSDDTTVSPVHVDVFDDGSRAQIVFDSESLVPGDYEIYIRNPGGLETTVGGITIAHPEPEIDVQPEPVELPEVVEQPEPVDRIIPVSKPQRPFAVNFITAWAPMLPIYGEVHDQNLFFPGVTVRLNMVSTKARLLDAGFELAAGMSFLDTSDYDAAFEFNLLVQKRLPNRVMAATFRIGEGIAVPITKNDVSKDLSIYTDTGVSFQWLLMEYFYMELGIDYIHLFTNLTGQLQNAMQKDIGLDYSHLFTEPPSGRFRPWFGIGLRF
ncbi:MAG: hypothetical protein LBG91_03150 [Treponema sp.]|jgi:hypothetical protein|nr:hypothetical protein [Treponema sp.]